VIRRMNFSAFARFLKRAQGWPSRRTSTGQSRLYGLLRGVSEIVKLSV
jgi:hypothetical protein